MAAPPEPTVINFAGAINEKVMESVEKMDVLTVLQRMVAQTPADEESEEIRDRLKGIMEQYSSMSPEEQDTFAKQIKQGLASKISARLQDPDNPLKFDALEDAIRGAVINQLILVGVVVAVFIFLLGMYSLWHE